MHRKGRNSAAWARNCANTSRRQTALRRHVEHLPALSAEYLSIKNALHPFSAAPANSIWIIFFVAASLIAAFALKAHCGLPPPRTVKRLYLAEPLFYHMPLHHTYTK